MPEKKEFEGGLTANRRSNTVRSVSTSSVIDRESIVIGRQKQVAVDAGASGSGGNMTVEVVDEGGTVTGIIVKCGCGQVQKIRFEFNE